MYTDATNNTNKVRPDLIYPELSYLLTGLCFKVHNEMGCYAREKQYGDLLAKFLEHESIDFQREQSIGESGNVLDFVVSQSVILELKAKRIVTKEDYYQTQRYLQESGMLLALIVNFRDKYLKPKRIVRIEKNPH